VRGARLQVRRLDRGSLGDHLDEATRILTAARADLWGHAVAEVEAIASPDSPVDGSRTLMEARQPGHDSVDMRQRMG
jgi:hypothetical protein